MPYACPRPETEASKDTRDPAYHRSSRRIRRSPAPPPSPAREVFLSLVLFSRPVHFSCPPIPDGKNFSFCSPASSRSLPMTVLSLFSRRRKGSADPFFSGPGRLRFSFLVFFCQNSVRLRMSPDVFILFFSYLFFSIMYRILLFFRKTDANSPSEQDKHIN